MFKGKKTEEQPKPTVRLIRDVREIEAAMAIIKDAVCTGQIPTGGSLPHAEIHLYASTLHPKSMYDPTYHPGYFHAVPIGMPDQVIKSPADLREEKRAALQAMIDRCKANVKSEADNIEKLTKELNGL